MQLRHCLSVAQATGYGLLISVLQRERGDFDGFLRFWRRFLTPGGLMYWQLLRGGDGEVISRFLFQYILELS